VPQDIFLATRSVAENIAFGIDVDDIDLSKVQDCARIAQIHDVIMSELPNGYDTQIGDRGMRLSGGQRQRIGIARALYWDPAVLVFDEATNALDTVTEARVLDAIKLHCTGKTLIVIAHRLSTVASCDQIAVLDQGRLMDLGSFSELRTRSSIFGDLVRADENTRLTD
jgi:ABC-type multidrug transport system fused ATPase/permease subunit